MKNQMPSEGLRLGRDSGSVLCDTLKKWPFRTAWGGGKLGWQNFTPRLLRSRQQNRQIQTACICSELGRRNGIEGTRHT